MVEGLGASGFQEEGQGLGAVSRLWRALRASISFSSKAARWPTTAAQAPQLPRTTKASGAGDLLDPTVDNAAVGASSLDLLIRSG